MSPLSLRTGCQQWSCKGLNVVTVDGSLLKIPLSLLFTTKPKSLIDCLLLERISLAGIARVTQVSQKWLQTYVNQKYFQIAKQVKVTQKEKGKLTIQADEMWSFVDNKGNKQWINKPEK